MLKLIVRVGVFYFLTWFFLMLLGATLQISTQAGVLPAGSETTLSFVVQWGPGLAGLLMLLIFRKDGMAISVVDRSMPASRYLWLFGLPAAAGLIAALGALAMAGATPNLAFTPLLVVTMLLGAIGEEIGWRGYLHRRLAPHMNGLGSSVLVGVLWAAIHVQLYAGGGVYMLVAAVAFVANTIMMYGLLADAKFNVAGATVYHVAINLSTFLALELLLETSMTQMVLWAVASVALAAGVVYWRRDAFFRRGDETMAEATPAAVR